MRLIDADDFGNRMYHEAFEKDSDLQKWDSGCWIRYKLFENVLREQPTVQPETNCSEFPNSSDTIYRQAAIEALDEQIEQCNKALGSFDISPKDEYAIKVERASLEAYKEQLENMPSAQPEIIHCCDCIYYDPEHIEKNGVRYEYRDMPKDAFDSLGTGLVNSEYGINVGGRCCRDYNVGYSEDKRVFVSGQNYCGRAGRKEDE